MATVDDYYARMQLTDEDKQAAATRALMMAAAAAFASNDGRPLGSILGNTMFAGVGSYDNSLSSAKRSKLDDIAFRKQAMDLANADKKAEEEKMLAEAMRNAAAPNATTFGQSAPDMGPPAAPMSGKERERQMLTNTINSLIAKGGGHLIGPLQDRLAKLDPEVFATKDVVDPKTGRRVRINVLKDATEIQSPYLPDKEKLHFADNGQQTGIGLDPFTGEVANPGIQKTMTPGEIDSSRRGDASLNLQRDQFNRGRVQYDAERGGMVNLDTGAFTPATQGGQPLAPKMPEKQKGELLAIDKQIGQVQGALEAVKAVPSAFGAMRGAATMAGSVPETIAGRSDSPDERQARAYVFNIVSSVINERAGAAQSAQELARLRSFLPAEMDGPQQIQNKLEGFQKYLTDSRAAVSQPITAAGPKPAADPLVVTDPNGKAHRFPTKQQADAFRQAAGL